MANLSNINNKFLVTTGGNVGIGNTSPTLSTLTVGIGSTNSPSQICQLAGSGSGVYSVLSLTNTNGIAADNNGVGLDFHVNAAYSATGRIQLIHPTAQSGTTTNSSMQFLTYGTVSGVTTFSPRMTIDYRGNVGIGTTTPQKKVHIEGTGGASEMQILVSSASDTVGHTAGIGLRGEGGEADGDFRIKGGIFFERIAGSFGNGKMILAVNSSVSNTSVTVADHALTIDTNKNVGIGTTSPTKKLTVNAGSLSGDGINITGSSSPAIYINETSGTVNSSFQNDGAGSYLGTSTSHPMIFRTANTERMRITSAGYVAIPNDAGSYAGAASLIVTKKSSVPYVQYQYSGTNTSFRLEMDEYVTAGNVRQYFTQTNGGVGYGFSMTFNTGSVIFGDLEVASATQNSGSAFKKDSKARMTLCQGSNSTALTDLQEYFNPNGAVGKIQTSGSATLFTTSSDYRLKEDLKSFSGLEMVSKIPVYDFKWKISDERSYGVMAHELQEVLPQAVGGDKDYEKDYVVKKAEYDDNHNLIKEAEYGKRPSYQTVDYSKIVPLLVKSIQELKAEIELLKSK